MATTIVFDTLAYAKKLKEVGVPEIQAEAHAEAIAELIDNKLATKHDLHKLEINLTKEMGALETRFNHKLSDLNHKLTIKLGGMLILAITVLATIIKL